MHKLKQKRGKKTVTHHFHHVTEKDGTKKHVYLGTHPKRAEERLTQLRVGRMRSQNKLIKDMEAAQTRLDKLCHYNRSYDDTLSDIKRRHSKQKQIEKLLSQKVKTPFPFYGYVLILVAVVILGSVFYYFLSSPTGTGAVVQDITKTASNQILSTAAGLITVIIIVGFVLHAVSHRYEHMMK